MTYSNYKYTYKLTHLINDKKDIHTSTLPYNDIDKAYNHYKNIFGNTTFICLEIIKKDGTVTILF